MRFTASAFLGLALLLYGDVSWAQDEEQKATPEERAKAWSQFFFEEVLLRSCDDPTLRSAIALPQPKLIVVATDDGKVKLTGRAGIKLKKSFIFDVEVVSPRSSPDEEETTLASLDGLSDGSTAELKLSWFKWKPQDNYEEMLEMIADWETRNANGKNSSTPTTPYEKMRTFVGPSISQQRAENYLNSTLSRPHTMLSAEDYQQVADTYKAWLKDESPYIPVFTAKANFEQREFKFFTPTDGPPAGLKELSESHTNYQLVGSLGWYVKGRAYLAASYRNGRTYMNGATEEFCTPTGAARILNCVDHFIAPPNKEKSETLEFEARGLMVGDFGIGAFVIRDLKANVTQIEIPVYRLQKLGASQMELNLGARAQWRSDTREFGFSVFAGPALSTVLRMFNN